MTNKFWKLLTHKYLVIGVLIALIAFEAAVYFGFIFQDIQETKAATLDAQAQEVVLACKDSSYHPACYDKEIPKLMDHLSMEDAFKVTAMVQSLDSVYQYCHVLAHELSAREADKNPDGWKDVVMRCPSGMCSNGCIHGAFQERFRSESMTDEEVLQIKPELAGVCEDRGKWVPTGLEQASCYHALGHLTMYITSADINKALLLCNDLAKKDDGRDFVQLCYDGSFMQIFQPLEPEDFALIEGKEVAKDQLKDFCSKFSGMAKGSCWSEGWPLYRPELQTSAGLTAYCNQADASQRDRCFESIIYVMTAQMNLDADKVFTYCSGLEKARAGNCFASAASRMIEVDYKNISRASGLCSKAEAYDPEHLCFGNLLRFSTFNYHPGSDEFYHVCNTLPDPWKDTCLNQQHA